MANMHLVTGYAGQQHVTAADHASLHVAMLGSGQSVLNRGNKLSASITDNNTIRVLDGDILMQGRHVRLAEDAYVDLVVETGTQGYLRHDLIVARYTQDPATAVEQVNLEVIKGEPAESNPADPEYTVGDLIEAHDLQNDMPLYRAVINGVVLETIEALFTVNIKDNIELQEYIQNHTHSASDINSGTLPISRGGTGATTSAAARTNLSVYSKTETDAKLGYSKAETISSDTKELFGLGANATPDDAFVHLNEQIDNVYKVGDTLTTVRTDLGDNWLLCNGDVFDETSYPDLAGIIPCRPTGFPVGVGSGTATTGGSSNCYAACIGENGRVIKISQRDTSGVGFSYSDENPTYPILNMDYKFVSLGVFTNYYAKKIKYINGYYFLLGFYYSNEAQKVLIKSTDFLSTGWSIVQTSGYGAPIDIIFDGQYYVVLCTNTASTTLSAELYDVDFNHISSKSVKTSTTTHSCNDLVYAGNNTSYCVSKVSGGSVFLYQIERNEGTLSCNPITLASSSSGDTYMNTRPIVLGDGRICVLYDNGSATVRAIYDPETGVVENTTLLTRITILSSNESLCSNIDQRANGTTFHSYSGYVYFVDSSGEVFCNENGLFPPSTYGGPIVYGGGKWFFIPQTSSATYTFYQFEPSVPTISVATGVYTYIKAKE